MIHCALTIAAFLFLCYVGYVALTWLVVFAFLTYVKLLEVFKK